MIHHTDRGGQYCLQPVSCEPSPGVVRQNMNRADNCYDNAFMESCFGTFETELEMTEYEHHRAARREIGESVAHDNLDRKHSALSDLPPYQIELRD